MISCSGGVPPPVSSSNHASRLAVPTGQQLLDVCTMSRSHWCYMYTGPLPLGQINCNCQPRCCSLTFCMSSLNATTPALRPHSRTPWPHEHVPPHHPRPSQRHLQSGVHKLNPQSATTLRPPQLLRCRRQHLLLPATLPCLRLLLPLLLRHQHERAGLLAPGGALAGWAPQGRPPYQAGRGACKAASSSFDMHVPGCHKFMLVGMPTAVFLLGYRMCSSAVRASRIA